MNAHKIEKIERLINHIAELSYLTDCEKRTLLIRSAHIAITITNNWRSVATGLVNGEQIDDIIDDLECDREYLAERLQMAHIASEVAA